MKRRIFALLLAFALVLCGCQKAEKACTAHVDADENYRCDTCDTSILVYIDFYTINDLHGKLADGENHPGVDELTCYLKTQQAADDYAIFLSTGDMWQGAAESNLTGGAIITDWMNALDFTAMTLGNHEYDWGESFIEKNAAAAEFPILAINVYDRETDQRVDYCQASVVVEHGGVRIGIIGAIGDCYSSISPDKVQDVYFKTGRELTALVKAESQRLRTQQDVDIVIYSVHDGYGNSGGSYIADSQLSSYYDVSLSDGYVDLVFEAHTHQRYVLKDSHGVYHIQCGGDNKGISHVELAYNTLTGDYFITDTALVYASVYENLPDDPIVQQLLDKYAEEISKADVICGYNSRERRSDWLRQKVADLYLEAGIEKWGGEYDIVLGGGFISIRSPYDLAKGDVTYGMLQNLFPFDNELVLCSIKGSDLLNRFIYTDNNNYFIARPDSRSIDPNQTYYIVVDSYSSSYAPNRLTEVARYGADIFARDLLADYIATGALEK